MYTNQSRISFFKIFLLCITFVFIQSLSLKHNMWYLKWKNEIVNPATNSFRTKNWNYCDLKCYYLQNYYNYDFVVIQFKQDAYRPDFASCYIKDQNSKFGYTIWYKKIENKFYQKVCGTDMEDYLESPNQYKILKVEGQGKQF